MLQAALGYVSIFFEVLFQRLNLSNVPDLDAVGDTAEGLTCIVTGPTSGIGREIAGALLRKGAHVVLACRSPERGKALQAQLHGEALHHSGCRSARSEAQLHTEALRQGNCRICCSEVMELDLASLDSVRAFARAWDERRQPLHILVNNAGIFSMGAQREETADGAEAHLGTNHLGPFLLTLLLLPSLQAAARQREKNRPVRIVNVSSKMHELCPSFRFRDPHFTQPGAYSSSAAYAQSKFAQVAFTAELRRRLPPQGGVVAAALHPGEVLTDVVRTLPLGLQALYRLALRLALLTPRQGARSAVYCATSRDPILAEYQCTEAPNCYFGSDCKCRWPSPQALDPEGAGALWHWSARSVALPPERDLPPPPPPLPPPEGAPRGEEAGRQAAGAGGRRAQTNHRP